LLESFSNCTAAIIPQIEKLREAARRLRMQIFEPVNKIRKNDRRTITLAAIFRQNRGEAKTRPKKRGAAIAK
jgi:hypothetical protein